MAHIILAIWHSSTGRDLRITRSTHNGKVSYECSCRSKNEVVGMRCGHLYSLFAATYRPEKVEFTKAGKKVLAKIIARREAR